MKSVDGPAGLHADITLCYGLGLLFYELQELIRSVCLGSQCDVFIPELTRRTLCCLLVRQKNSAFSRYNANHQHVILVLINKKIQYFP